MIRHRLIPIHEGNKRAKCTVCEQAWTSHNVRSACPGAPVYPFEELPAYLKTPTALWRERKVPPDESKPDGAYRILKAPYYRLVYDERTAIHKPLTEKQLAASEKRKEATRKKYTCSLCDTFYTGRYERRDFSRGVCKKCQYAISRYNEQISWARSLLDNEAVVLDIQTEPEIQPYTNQEQRPLLVGYTAMDLRSGKIERQADMSTREDLHIIKHLACPEYSVLEPYLWVLTLYPSALWAVQHELERNAKGVYLFNPCLHELLVTNHIEYRRDGKHPVSIYGWHDLPFNKEQTARQVLEQVCTLHGVAIRGTHAELMRKMVYHLAAQTPMSIEESKAQS